MNIDGFKGLHNTKQSRRLPLGALTVAENIDIDDLGGIVLREGFVLSAAFTSITSAYATRDQERLFVVDSGDLKLVYEDLTSATIKTGVGTDRIFWTEAGNQVFLSSGHIIEEDNNVIDWRTPTAPQATVTAVSGNLPAGQYQVAVTYQKGREGGCNAPVTIDVGDDSGLGITVTALAPYDINIYVSDLNGTELYLVDTITSGGIVVNDMKNLTYPLDEVHKQTYPVPDNIEQVAFYEAKLWASEYLSEKNQTIIWYSKAFAWHLFDTYSDYIAVPGKVLMLEATPQGLVIGTDQEIYAWTVENSLIQLAEYGVVGGYPSDFKQNGNILIHTKRGICHALPFENLTEQKVSLEPGLDCYTKVMEQNGIERCVVLNDGGGVANNKL